MSFCQHRLVLLSFGSVVTGSVSTLALKAVYETRIHGEAFAKPFFMELLVGAAMTTSLAMVPCERGVGVMPARTRSRARHYAPLVPLAAGDVLVGLGDMAAVLLAPASIVSLVNCSILVFSAAATHTVLGARYSRAQWAGIITAAAGVLVVGAASCFSDDEDDDERAARGGSAPAGVLLALGARALQAMQFAFEERYMKRGRFSPALQVGAEGALETCVCATLVLPLAHALPGGDHGHLEDAAATARMLRVSPSLCALCALVLASLAALNPLSMAIGARGGTVLRVFVEVGRPAIVWAAALAVGRWGGAGFGERWSSPASWIELLGFTALVLGLALYCGGERRDPGVDAAAAAIRVAAGEESLLPEGQFEDSDCVLHDAPADRSTRKAPPR